MTRWARFDDDGICLWIVSLKPDVDGDEEEEKVIEVPEGVLPDDIWFDGSEVVLSEDLDITIPRTLPVSLTPFSLTLPEDTIGFIEGESYRGSVEIPTAEPRSVTIDLRGKYRGRYRIEVRSYTEERLEAYPPVKDQLDAIWKALEVMDLPKDAKAMLDSIQAVKTRYPKA
jgi:hypothetical protein